MADPVIPQSAFSDIGAATSDIFGFFGAQSKAKGDLAEAADYGLASELATENVRFTEESTAIKEAQETRAITKSLGETEAGVAGAGFAASGTAMDILRESAAQGALTKGVLAEQGLITEAGYKEQAQAYTNMQQAAVAAASAEKTSGIGKLIGAGIDIAAVVAAPFTGGASLLAGAAANAALSSSDMAIENQSPGQ